MQANLSLILQYIAESNLNATELHQIHSAINMQVNTSSSIPSLQANLSAQNAADISTVGLSSSSLEPSTAPVLKDFSKEYTKMNRSLDDAKELTPCTRTQKPLAVIKLLQEDKINGNNSNYVSLLESAYHSACPLKMQLLKDELQFVKGTNSGLFDSLQIDEATIQKLDSTKTKFKMIDGVWHITSSKQVVKKKLKTTLSVVEKAAAISNKKITDSMIDTSKQKQEKWYRYLSVMNIYEEAEKLYEDAAGSNCKDLLAKLKEKKYWASNLESFIQATIELVKKNFGDHRTKGTTVELQPILCSKIGELIEMDLTFLSTSNESIDSAKILLVLIDHFSKYVVIECVHPTRDAATVLAALERGLKKFKIQKIESILSDNGSEFKNETMERYLKEKGIRFKHGLPYRPTTQGLVERQNGTIKKKIDLLLQSGKKYTIPELIVEIEKIINSSHHRALNNRTPMEVINVLSTDVSTIQNQEEAMEKLMEQHLLQQDIQTTQQNNANYEKKRRLTGKTRVQFSVGDKVLVAVPNRLRGKNDKNVFCRLATIHEKFGVNVLLRWGNTGGVYKGEEAGMVSNRKYHLQDLLHYCHGNHRYVTPNSSEVAIEQDSEEWKKEEETPIQLDETLRFIDITIANETSNEANSELEIEMSRSENEVIQINGEFEVDLDLQRAVNELCNSCDNEDSLHEITMEDILSLLIPTKMMEMNDLEEIEDVEEVETTPMRKRVRRCQQGGEKRVRLSTLK